MMILIPVLSVLFAAGGEEAPLPVRLMFEEPAVSLPILGSQGEPLRLGVTAAAQIRGSLPFGSADRGTVIVGGNTITITDRLDYSDLFNPGWGFTLEADLMFRPPPPRPEGPPWERTPSVGGYVAFEWDWYGGAEATDNAGTRVRPDTMRIPSILAGFKAEGTVQGDFFGDLRFGLGAAHYSAVNGTFRPAGGLDVRGELFAETWAFALELRMHFGWRLGPFGIVFGFGGRLMGPPRPGVNASLDPDTFYTLDLELGAQLGF